jgi:hypothetical protein
MRQGIGGTGDGTVLSASLAQEYELPELPSAAYFMLANRTGE